MEKIEALAYFLVLFKRGIETRKGERLHLASLSVGGRQRKALKQVFYKDKNKYRTCIYRLTYI